MGYSFVSSVNMVPLETGQENKITALIIANRAGKKKAPNIHLAHRAATKLTEQLNCNSKEQQNLVGIY